MQLLMIILFEYQLILTHCAEQWPPRPTTCIRTDTDHDLLLCFLGGENSDTPILQKLEKRKETTTILTFASDQGSDDGLTKVFFFILCNIYNIFSAAFLRPRLQKTRCCNQPSSNHRVQIACRYSELRISPPHSVCLSFVYFFTRVFHFNEISFNMFAKANSSLEIKGWQGLEIQQS